MREIKFRAWVKKYKFIGQITSMDFQHKGTRDCGAYVVEREWTTGDWDATFYKFRSIVVMQYTGHKINGKEVYEGDVLKNGDLNLQVYWEEGQFLAQDKNVYDSLESISIACIGSKIIGNIYEQPELIGGNK